MTLYPLPGLSTVRTTPQYQVMREGPSIQTGMKKRDVLAMRTSASQWTEGKGPDTVEQMFQRNGSYGASKLPGCMLLLFIKKDFFFNVDHF